jgi:hypothetical protein
MAYRFFKAWSDFFNLKQFGDAESKIQARVVNARIQISENIFAMWRDLSIHSAFFRCHVERSETSLAIAY